MFTYTVCTVINSLNFMVDVGLCMINKGSQSWMKIVYTLNSTNICNIMILHSWVIGWSCITWYNVYIARVYSISNICSTSCSLVNSLFTFVHASWKVVHVYIYCILYLILISCKWYNTELTRYKIQNTLYPYHNSFIHPLTDWKGCQSVIFTTVELLVHLLYPRSEGEGGVLFYPCVSVCLSFCVSVCP